METELRPLSLGEILDRTFQLYRTHFRLFAGIGAIAGGARLAANALNLAVAHGLARERNPGTAALVSNGFSSLLAAAVTLTAYALVFAVVTRAVAAVYLGEGITTREAYRTVLPRTLRYFGLSLAAFLLSWWPAAVAGALLGATAAATRASATSGPRMVTGLLGLCFVLASFFGMWLFLRYTLSSAACVYEDLNVRRSLRRSTVLSHGTRGRIFILIFLTGILQSILGLALAAPLFAPLSRGHVSMGATMYTLLVGFVSTCLTIPIYGIGLTLFYFDSRVRKEGFDIEWLLTRSQGSQASPNGGLRTDPALG